MASFPSIMERHVRLPPSAPPRYEASPEYLKELREARTAQRAHHTRLMEHHMKIWKSTWATYQNRIPLPTEAQQASLDKKRLKIHSNLAKAESSLATQIRTEKIGLANFLFNRISTQCKLTGVHMWMAKADGQTRHHALSADRRKK